MQIEQTPWIPLSLLNDLMCKTETHMTAKTKMFVIMLGILIL